MSESSVMGTGGGLGYLTEVADPMMFNQLGRFTCVPACVRQVLLGDAIDISEDDLRNSIGYYDGVECMPWDVGPVINLWHPRLEYMSGCLLDPDTDLYLGRDPWIASLVTDHASQHAVVVVGGDSNIVRIRDPWGLSGPGSGSGSAATIRRTDFDWRWRATGFAGVVPHRLKGQRP